jgi:hypothetical protein
MSIASVVLRGYGASNYIEYIPTLGYGAFPIDAIPNTPGVEYTVLNTRPHYTVRNTRPHYTVGEGRPHYRATEER